MQRPKHAGAITVQLHPDGEYKRWKRLQDKGDTFKVPGQGKWLVIGYRLPLRGVFLHRFQTRQEADVFAAHLADTIDEEDFVGFGVESFEYIPHDGPWRNQPTRAERKKQVWKFMRDYQEAHGRRAAVHEIRKGLRIGRNQVDSIIQELVRDGRVIRVTGQVRHYEAINKRYRRD